MRRRSKIWQAVFLMLGATLAFVGMQAVVKQARLDGLDTTEVMFFRTAPGLPLLWWSLRRRGEGLRPKEPIDIGIRSVLGTLAMGTNFLSMRWLSLAEFSILNLLQPVFVALAAPFVLGELMKRNVALALATGLLGALVLVRSGSDVHALAFVPGALGIASALFSAFAQMWVRKATGSDPAERIVFHFAAWVSIASLVVGRVTGHFRDLPVGISSAKFLTEVLAMATLGTLGQVLMTRAYSQGEAAVVAIVGYSGVALAVAFDVIFFGVRPEPGALGGAALMLVSGALLVRG